MRALVVLHVPASQLLPESRPEYKTIKCHFIYNLLYYLANERAPGSVLRETRYGTMHECLRRASEHCVCRFVFALCVAKIKYLSFMSTAYDGLANNQMC